MLWLEKNNEIQIKGEKQLVNMTDSINFMSLKIDVREKERWIREVEKFEYTADRMEQYS